ncbi:DMT family transporter [Paenibacillus ehimensis]|uniref:Multidrug efflux SMR transporter n=1 Tax=Paenibacillus ehimensis TaxID=79264 RepID=A0ABT8V6V1_9BACL|nr:multidrug efflux SMR transporter [Paenibacillus ehimensis]MDO3677168.1 multidrug efflux SMR transporter [Paenibacillus ehimensis]MEC0212930.1 multidrug efflux SMR transporter [Paenibacillus ehimensis]
MAWGDLILAGLLEIVGVIGIKKVAENNSWTNNLMLYGGFFASFSLLTQAMQEIPLSVAYTVWTGIGTLGSAAVGMLFFKEPRSGLRLICMVGIALTIAGLRLTG